MERRHSSFWQAFLAARGGGLPATRVGRLRLAGLRLLQRLVNPVLLVSVLDLGESNAFKTYYACLKTCPLAEPEKTDLSAIVLDELEHEFTFRRESQRLGITHVRDFVLGMNDGLVEILGAVTGLTAVYAGRPLTVAVSGLVVGIAGALSIGIGAFIAVRSQRQVDEGLQERMEVLFAVAPERAVAEYRDRLAQSGVPGELAEEIAQRVGKSREAITRLLQDENKENEVRSGLSTGLAYLLGVVFPVAPYFVAGSSLAALAAAAGLALATVAVLVSVLSGISLRKKVLEMVISGFAAAAISYGFGAALQSLLGVRL